MIVGEGVEGTGLAVGGVEADAVGVEVARATGGAPVGVAPEMALYTPRTLMVSVGVISFSKEADGAKICMRLPSSL